MLLQELKELKKRLKDAQNNDKQIEAVSDKDNAEVAKLKEELNKVKENYRIMLDRTGYDPKENKFRPKVTANLTQKATKQAKTSSLKKDKEADMFAEVSLFYLYLLIFKVYPRKLPKSLQ